MGKLITAIIIGLFTVIYGVYDIVGGDIVGSAIGLGIGTLSLFTAYRIWRQLQKAKSEAKR